MKTTHLGMIEQHSYNCIIGEDYPAPIVDYQESARHARHELWRVAGTPLAREEKTRILAKHVKPRKEPERR